MRKERIARHGPRVQAYTKYLGKWDANSPVVGGMAPPTNEGRAFIRVARPDLWDEKPRGFIRSGVSQKLTRSIHYG
jgi:hypothetical protein